MFTAMLSNSVLGMQPEANIVLSLIVAAVLLDRALLAFSGDAHIVLFLIVVAVSLLWGIFRPNVGRFLSRIFAVAAIGGGIGFLTWGICAAALGDAIRSPFGLISLVAEPSEAIGWGAGFLAAGVTALVLSFVGGGTCRDGREESC